MNVLPTLGARKDLVGQTEIRLVGVFFGLLVLSMMPVLITGLGLVTAFGSDRTSFVDALCSGRDALLSVARFSTQGYRSSIGSLILEPAPQDKSAMMLQALEAARTDAEIDDLDPTRAFVVFAGQSPSLGAHTEATRSGFDMPVVPILDAVGTKSHVFVSQACASAAVALILGKEVIETEFAQLVVVISAAMVNVYEFAGMDAVRGLSRSKPRPFDRERDGVAVGDGAGCVILESADHLGARGGTALAEFRSGATALSGGGDVALDPEIVYRTMKRAIMDSRIDRVDYVQAHATGTIQGDAAELAALEHLCAELDQDELVTSSHKGAIGHLFHASALPGLAVAIHAIQTGIAAPTVGLCDPLPAERVCLPKSPVTLSKRQYAMVNSFGFSGNISSIVLARTT